MFLWGIDNHPCLVVEYPKAIPAFGLFGSRLEHARGCTPDRLHVRSNILAVAGGA